MDSISTQMTAQSPSRFGMPMIGSAFGATCSPATGTVALVRDVAGLAAVQGAFLGTPAWRPPVC